MDILFSQTASLLATLLTASVPEFRIPALILMVAGGIGGGIVGRKGIQHHNQCCGVVKPAFQMACEEDILRKNPFDFKLSDVVKNDSQKRIALTQEQEDLFMNFIKTENSFKLGARMIIEIMEE